jgi:hypothetical protein
VEILAPEYVRLRREAMLAQIRNYLRVGKFIKDWTGDYLRAGKILNAWTALTGDALKPKGAWVKYWNDSELQCLTCFKIWSFFPPPDTPFYDLLMPRRSADYPAERGTTLDHPAVAGSMPPIRRVTTPPATDLELANYHLIDVKDEEQTETVLRKETKTYPNDSKALITTKVGITDSVTKSVTLEANKVTTSGGQGGIQIVGFATIQGQIQQQLSRRYAVQSQRTLTVNEEIQVAIKGRSAVELTITWKLIWLKGTAILGGTYKTRAEVPYSIPQRLTVEWRIKDVPLTRESG